MYVYMFKISIISKQTSTKTHTCTHTHIYEHILYIHIRRTPLPLRWWMLLPYWHRHSSGCPTIPPPLPAHRAYMTVFIIIINIIIIHRFIVALHRHRCRHRVLLFDFKYHTESVLFITSTRSDAIRLELFHSHCLLYNFQLNS